MSHEDTRRPRCRWTKSDYGPTHSSHPFGGRKLITSSRCGNRILEGMQSHDTNRQGNNTVGTHRNRSGSRHSSGSRNRSSSKNSSGSRDRSGSRNSSGSRNKSGSRDRCGSRNRSGSRDRCCSRNRSDSRDRSGSRNRSGSRSGERSSCSRGSSLERDRECKRLRVPRNQPGHGRNVLTEKKKSSCRNTRKARKSPLSSATSNGSTDNFKANWLLKKAAASPRNQKSGLRAPRVDQEQSEISESDTRNVCYQRGRVKHTRYTIRNGSLRSISQNPLTADSDLSIGRANSQSNAQLQSYNAKSQVNLLPRAKNCNDTLALHTQQHRSSKHINTEFKKVPMKDVTRPGHQRSMIRLIDHLKMKESSHQVNQHQLSPQEDIDNTTNCNCDSCVQEDAVPSSKAHRGSGMKRFLGIDSSSKNAEKNGGCAKDVALPVKGCSKRAAFKGPHHEADCDDKQVSVHKHSAKSKECPSSPMLEATRQCQDSLAGDCSDLSPLHTTVSSNYFCQCQTGQSEVGCGGNQSFDCLTDTRQLGPMPSRELGSYTEGQGRDGELSKNEHGVCDQRSFGNACKAESDDLNRECERCHQIFNVDDAMSQLKLERRETAIVNSVNRRKKNSSNSAAPQKANVVQKTLESKEGRVRDNFESFDGQTPDVGQIPKQHHRVHERNQKRLTSSNDNHVKGNSNHNLRDHNGNMGNGTFLYYEGAASKTNKDDDEVCDNIGQEKRASVYSTESKQRSRYSSIEREFKSLVKDVSRIDFDKSKDHNLEVKTREQRLNSESGDRPLSQTSPQKSKKKDKLTRKQIFAYYNDSSKWKNSRRNVKTSRTASPVCNKGDRSDTASREHFLGHLQAAIPSIVRESSIDTSPIVTPHPLRQKQGNQQRQLQQQQHEQQQSQKTNLSHSSLPNIKHCFKRVERATSKSPSRKKYRSPQGQLCPQNTEDSPTSRQSTRRQKLANQWRRQMQPLRLTAVDSSPSVAQASANSSQIISMPSNDNSENDENVSSVSNTHLSRRPHMIWAGADPRVTEKDDPQGTEKFCEMIQAVKKKLQNNVTQVSSVSNVNTSNIAVKAKTDMSFLADYILSLWENQWLCDVQVTVQGKKLLAHKLILAAFSDVFCPNNPHPHPSISFDIPDSTFEAVEQIFQYMYTGNMDLTDELLEPVLAAALYMGVTEVICLVQDIMACADTGSIQTCMGIARANCLPYDIAKTPAVRKNLSQLLGTGFFPYITIDELHVILDDPDVEVESEEVTLHVVLEWILSHPDVDYNKELPELLEKITLESIPPQRLTAYMNEYPGIFSIPAVTDIMLGIFQYHATKAKVSKVPICQTKTPTLVEISAERRNSGGFEYPPPNPPKCIYSANSPISIVQTSPLSFNPSLRRSFTPTSKRSYNATSHKSPSQRRIYDGRGNEEYIVNNQPSKHPRFPFNYAAPVRLSDYRESIYRNGNDSRKSPQSDDDDIDQRPESARPANKVRFGLNNSNSKASLPRVYSIRPSRQATRGTLSGNDPHGSHNNNNSGGCSFGGGTTRLTFSPSKNGNDFTKDYREYVGIVDSQSKGKAANARGNFRHPDSSGFSLSVFPKDFDLRAKTTLSSSHNTVLGSTFTPLSSMSVLSEVEMREFDPISSPPTVNGRGGNRHVVDSPDDQEVVNSTFEIDEAGCPILSATDDKVFQEMDQSMTASSALVGLDDTVLCSPDLWRTDPGLNPCHEAMEDWPITPNRFTSRLNDSLSNCPRISKSLSFLGHDDSISAFQPYNPYT